MIAEPDYRAATRLGRAVRAATDGASVTTGGHREGHRQSNWLRDVILGGQDGSVTSSRWCRSWSCPPPPHLSWRSS